jgi:glycosyltransferase involved in cell wall biosynthesis
VPLQSDTDYAAGATGVLEAMAMRKPLIVSDAPGIRDYVTPGETACLVPPGDPDALAHVIGELLADRARAETIASRARCVVDAGRNLDSYVTTIAGIVREVLPT